MSFDTVLFYLLAIVLVVAAFRVITASSPVTGVLHLILTFFTASMMWMLIQAEFLALVLVIVYVGAVMVLFLFVVMMLDMRTEGLQAGPEGLSAAGPDHRRDHGAGNGLRDAACLGRRPRAAGPGR